MNIQKITTIIILAMIQFVYGSNFIKGKIISLKNEPLVGVNVFIKNSYDGCTSKADGSFVIKTKKKGNLEVVAKCIGYEDNTTKVELKDSVNLSIRLKEKLYRTNVVTVTAGAFEAGDEKKAVIMSSYDIVTTAGSNADIVRAFQTLPGVTKVGEGEGLYVRGGDGREAALYVDGAEVKHPYYSKTPDMTSRGRFSPFLFKGTYFSTGGFSAEYGKALSSAMILNTIDFPDESYYQVSLGSTGAGLGFNKKNKNNSFGFNFDGYDLKAYNEMNKSRLNWNNVPVGSDMIMTFRQKTSETGMLKFTATSGIEKAELNVNDINTLETHKYDMNNFNLFTCLNYKEILSDKWILNTTGSFSRNYDFNKYDTIPLHTADNIYQAKIKLSYLLGEISTVNFGGDYTVYDYYFKRSKYSNSPENKLSAVFAEAQLPINQDLVFCPGARLEHSSIVNKTVISPRFSAAYKLGENQNISFATGRFYQLPADTFLNYKNLKDYEYADHYILNFQSMTEKQTFRAEVFYKNYGKLVSTIPDTSFNGNGFATGLDLYWRDKKTFDGLDYWVTYSYLYTKRKYLNFPVEAVPNFAAEHTFSLVMKKYLPSISSNISVTYQFCTGRTYFNPNNSNFMGDRAGNYNNLSITYVYLSKLFGSNAVWVCSADNIIGFDNVYSYKYSGDGKNREAIKAASKRGIYLGLYLSFGRDNTDDF